MKIQLLVNGGKILVQNLQLRKPGKRMTSTPSKSMHILNFDVNVNGGPFPCGHCGHIFRAFNRKCRAGDLTGYFSVSNDTLMINFGEPKFDIKGQIIFVIRVIMSPEFHDMTQV